MIEFRISPHTVKPGVEMVEILMDGKMVGTLCPALEGVTLISPHIKEVLPQSNEGSLVPVPTVKITFDPRPYVIRDGRLIKVGSG